MQSEMPAPGSYEPFRLIVQADKAYRDAIGGDEWPDWAEKGGEDDGEPYHTGGA